MDHFGRFAWMVGVAATTLLLIDSDAVADVAACRVETTCRTALPGKVCGYGQRDCNPFLRDPVGAVTRLDAYGEILAFHRGPYVSLVGASPTSNNHWQGAARPMRIDGTSLDGRFFVTTSSDEGGTARFALSHFAVGGTATASRWGTNKLFSGQDSWVSAPPSTDTIVAQVDITSANWHPGGPQAIGQFLIVGVENAKHAPKNALIVAYDLAGPSGTRPPHVGWQPIWTFPLVNGEQSDQAAAVAVAKLADDSYMMVVAGIDSRKLSFYRSTTCDLRDPKWRLLAPPFDAHAKVPGWGPPDPPPSVQQPGMPGYQALNFVTDENGALFLIGTWKDDDGWPRYAGADKVDVFRVSVGCPMPPMPQAPNISLAKVGSRTLYCSSRGGLQCNLDAAVGVYVDDNHRLIVYATEHGMNGAGTSTRMKEFRSLPAPNEQACTKEEDAWIELYEDSDFGGRTVVIDFNKRSAPYLATFSKMDAFNDLASSARWCFPAGHGFTLFQDADHKGASFTFHGDGKMQSAPRLSDLRFAQTTIGMNDRASSGRWQ